MRLELELDTQEETYLAYLGEESQTATPQATIRRMLQDLMDSEGPCLDPRISRFAAWRRAAGQRDADVRCVGKRPCAGCAPYLAEVTK